MKQMKQWMHWVLALVLLVMSLSVSAAAAETITVNVTNTPVRGKRPACSLCALRTSRMNGAIPS